MTKNCLNSVAVSMKNNTVHFPTSVLVFTGRIQCFYDYTHRDITHWLNKQDFILVTHFAVLFLHFGQTPGYADDKNTPSSVVRINTRKVLSKYFFSEFYSLVLKKKHELL